MAYTTINKSTDYFNTVTYSGTGSAQSITGVGFKPDWLWIKHREDVSNHKLQDVVRGSTKVIGSNEDVAEATVAQGVTSFDSDGFSLGTDVSVNGTGAAGIVAWNWLAGGSQGSSNTDGSINTTYTSVNTTAGFSISQYTGTGSGSNSTVGHGLGVKPAMIIVKNLGSTGNWVVWHKSLASETNNYLRLDTNQAPGTTTNYWNSAAPTNQVFGVSPDGYNNNKNGENIIAYCFAEKKGFSKFGSYTGNGNADGTFIYTGFKPAFLMTKRTDTTSEWVIFDNKRDSFNQVQKFLQPNSNSAEGNDNGTSSGKQIDFLSNGWKMRGTTGGMNASGGTYIYMAFAEEPLVANVGASIPATAR